MKENIHRLFRTIMNPKLFVTYMLMNWLNRCLPDRIYLFIRYYLAVGRRLNLNPPRYFSEKMQWLKLNDRNPAYTMMADKYSVRDYVREKIGDEYLIPLIGIYNNFSEIDFDALPNQFVLKPTHSCGVYICKDKSKFSINEVKCKIEASLNSNYFFLHREWEYKNILPRILVQQYLADDQQESLYDYKFYCFNGEPKFLYLALGGAGNLKNLRMNFLNFDWSLTPFQRPDHLQFEVLPPKPHCLDKMVELARLLSHNIPFVRVDFFVVDNKIYFGEMTFHPGAGFAPFSPRKYELLYGELIRLPRTNERWPGN